jgi:dipeptidyl aminopeptidase/acylaminoacyl peptidase
MSNIRTSFFAAMTATALTFVAQTAPAQVGLPAAPHPATLDDLDHLLGVGDLRVSPDGKWVAYTVSKTDVAADKHITDLWMVSWDGAQDIRLTYETDTSVSDPRWSPDGKYISFLSDRPGAPKVKGSQIWGLDRRGGEARQLTGITGNLSSTSGHRIPRNCCSP